jgi:phosphoesterase RecJ-like protein
METSLNDSNNVINKKQIIEAWHVIQKAKKITLLTHHRPDGDGISACAALAYLLEKQNKKIETIYPCLPEFNFVRQPKNILINTHQQIPDVIIVLDTANYSRLYWPDIFKQIPLINIDHHISNTIQGTFNFVYEKHTSACESLYLILEIIDKQLINTYVAECLLTGILYDSLTFCTQATTANTLRIAAQLIDLGANLFEIKKELISNKTSQTIALWGKIISTIQETPSQIAVWVTITQQDLKQFNLTQAELAGFSNFLSQFCKNDVTILFYENEQEQTKISFRSKTTDVNKIATKLGGGGHYNAAGLILNESLPEAVKKITVLF